MSFVQGLSWMPSGGDAVPRRQLVSHLGEGGSDKVNGVFGSAWISLASAFLWMP